MRLQSESGGMQFAVMGWPPDGPSLELDHERFRYAGKFRSGQTGVSVAREGEAVVGAISFNADRTNEETLKVRYLTVRDDRHGEDIGPRLLRFTSERASERDFERVRIGVNNPFSYQAAYRAGFGFTGETGALSELVCEWPADRATERYRAGLERFAERDLPPEAETFVSQWERRPLPGVVSMP
jgi:GNAT superfamily N-acetyltransferase